MMKDVRDNKIPKYENEVFITWFDMDGICRTFVKPKSKIELSHAKGNSAYVFQYGDKPPILVDARNVISMSKESRDHLAMRDRVGGVCAIAIIIHSPLSRLIGNFFMGLNKPTVPTKLFTKESEALKWLHKFL